MRPDSCAQYSCYALETKGGGHGIESWRQGVLRLGEGKLLVFLCFRQPQESASVKSTGPIDSKSGVLSDIRLPAWKEGYLGSLRFNCYFSALKSMYLGLIKFFILAQIYPDMRDTPAREDQVLLIQVKVTLLANSKVYTMLSTSQSFELHLRLEERANARKCVAGVHYLFCNFFRWME